MNVGDTWNGWTINKLLGEGSYGKVYRIVREEYGHIYESALKVIRIPSNETEATIARNEGMSDAELLNYYRSIINKLVAEFTMMSHLRGNSNIVSYEDHEVVRHPGEFVWDIFIRMELLTPLSAHIQSTAMTVGDIVKLGTDICRALEVCRDNNIIHRDIKPENIFYSKTGNYKLGDFGIARETGLNQAMTKVGTYSYMAPEITKGVMYDSTVDIYSLGIVLYRFLNNNRLPFLPPYPETIRHTDRELANQKRMRGEEMPAPCNADPELAAIVLKACAYKPEDRYQTAEEMRIALENYAAGGADERVAVSPADAGKTGTGDTESTIKEMAVARKKSRGRKIIITLLVLLLILLGLAGAALYFTDYYLEYYTPDYPAGEISEEDEKYGFNGSWCYDESMAKTIKYEDVTAYVPTNWRRYILDMSTYGEESEGRIAMLSGADGLRVAWFKIEYMGEYESIKEFRKSDRGKSVNCDGKKIEYDGCDEACSINIFTNLDGETVLARLLLVDGKVYWVGGGGVGENFSITYYTKMLDSVEINTEE